MQTWTRHRHPHFSADYLALKSLAEGKLPITHSLETQPTVFACAKWIDAGLRSGMPSGPAGAAGLQTIHTKLPKYYPSYDYFL